MTTSYASALDDLYSLHTKAEAWSADEIILEVATSFLDDTPVAINLSKTIGHKKNVPSAKKRNDGSCFWLFSKWNENNKEFRSKFIHPVFVQACHASGFIIHAEYDPAYNCIVFSCEMGKYHDEKKNKAYRDSRPRDNVKKPDKPPVPRKRRPFRPAKPSPKTAHNDSDDNEEGKKECKKVCPFKFRVYWDTVQMRWFLPVKQRGSIHHCDHLQETPEFLRYQSRHASSNELQISKDALESHISATATASLFAKRTGTYMDWHQLQYLKQKQKNKTIGSDSYDVTPVDRLIADLEKDPKTSFVVLYGEFTSGLLTIKKRTKHMNNAATVTDVKEKLKDSTDSAEQFARDYKNRCNLTHSKTGQIVLAVAWTNEEARRKFDMYPEFLGGDDTEDTNSEERPLYTLCGKDNMNESFGHTWAFMPSKSRWVYSWIFSMLPVLHPGSALSRVEQFIMDACPQETAAGQAICGEGVHMHKVLPKAHLRHCAWHKINRNFTEDSTYKAILTSARTRSVESSIEVDVLVNWLWYFIKHYESLEEVEFSMTLLNKYLNEGQKDHHGELKDDVRVAIRQFITKSFQYNGSMLFEATFSELMTMGNCTTSINEAEHHAYKIHAAGPRPQHNIAEAACRINHMNEEKEVRKSTKVAKAMKSNYGKASDREERDNLLSEFCNNHLRNEHDKAKQYCTYMASNNVFYVKRKPQMNTFTNIDENLELSLTICKDLFNKRDEDLSEAKGNKNKKKIRDNWDKKFSSGKKGIAEYKVILLKVLQDIIPRFERTRTVKMSESTNKEGDIEIVITCDCRMKVKWGTACRHIYAIIKRYPSVQDAKVRWLVSYSYYYGRNDQISAKLVEIRDKCGYHGVPLSKSELNAIEADHALSKPNVPLEYFERSLDGKIRLVDGTYWARHAKRLSNEIGLNEQCFGCSPCTSDDGRDSHSINTNTKKPSKIGAAAPVGVTQELHCKDDYKVPSQLDFNNNNDNDGWDSNSGLDVDMNVSNLSKDPYHNLMPMYQTCTGGKGTDKGDEFHPMYESCTKLARHLGAPGDKIMVDTFTSMHSDIQQILRNGFSTMRAQLVVAESSLDGRKLTGSASLPSTITSNRKPKRKKKISSPPNKKKARKK